MVMRRRSYCQLMQTDRKNVSTAAAVIDLLNSTVWMSKKKWKALLLFPCSPPSDYIIRNHKWVLADVCLLAALCVAATTVVQSLCL